MSIYNPAKSSVPGGSTTDVQINNGGVFYGDSVFTYDPGTGLVTIDGSLQSLGGNNSFGGIQNSGSYYINGSTQVIDFNGILYYPIGTDPIIDNQNNLIISSDAFQGLKLASTDTVMIDTQGNYYGASSGLVIIDPSGDASFAFVDSSFGFRVAGGLALISSDGSASFLGGEFALDAQGYHTSESYYRGNGNLLADNLGNTYYGTGQIWTDGGNLHFYGTLDQNGVIYVDSSGFLHTPVGFKDNAGSAGTTGQVLTSLTGTGTAYLSGLVVLKSTGAINGKTVGNTSIYTVPTGRTLMVTGAVVRCTAASAITVGASAGIGTASGTSNIFAAGTLTSLTATTATYTFMQTTGATLALAAASQVWFNLTVAATGTSQTLAVDLIGYLI